MCAAAAAAVRAGLLAFHSHDTTRCDAANKCVRHSFRPFAFALMRDETMADLEACVVALEQTTEFLWGKKLKFYAGGGDKAGVGGCLLGSL